MFRRRVVGPDEAPPSDAFYSQSIQSGHLPQNFTAFRQAERLYKRNPLDLSSAVSSDSVALDGRLDELRCFEMDGEIKRVFGLKGHPGFIYIPSALSPSRQKSLAANTFSTYTLPPNRSNLDAHYDFGNEFVGFYNVVEQNLALSYSKKDGLLVSTRDRAEIETLLRKLRWVTLGHQYDWTTKAYDFSRPAYEIPRELIGLSREIALKAVDFADYTPQAGIINYYQLGDTLTGHVDRSEPNMSPPLISLSLGHSAVFLVGGPDRDDPVSAVVLKSGDVCLLTGPAREAFHGVPRVLEDSLPDFLQSIWPLHNARININIRQVH